MIFFLIYSDINGIIIYIITKPERSFPDEKSMFIVPGSMFDVKLNRCGYGGGYYDTYTAEKKVKKTKTNKKQHL